MDETSFIAALRALPLHPGARGLKDDTAVLEVGGETLVVTHDTMTEGVHWLPGQDMADVAWKLMAVNLSDLAAMGAEPVGVLLGYQLGGDDSAFIAGLKEALEAFDVKLLGGDTVSGSGARSFGLTAIGRATHRPVPSRSGARPGDTVWLCGSVGAAMLGFEALRDGTGADDTAFRRPAPFLIEGKALAPLVTAMMDVSDGLLLDATRMAEASGVTFDLTPQQIPVADLSRLMDCLTWGDDYALLFTSKPEVNPPVEAHRIGSVIERQACLLLLDGKLPPPDLQLGYRHDSRR